MSTSTKFWGIVPAAGVGKRMQSHRPKQYLVLNGCTVIEQSLSRLLEANVFEAIAVAISQGDPYWPEIGISSHSRIIKASGGKERSDSVLSALHSIEGKARADDWVLVHDAARPCITIGDILKLIETLCDDAIGGILALASHDTLKSVNDSCIVETLDRSHIWRALTPQMFRYKKLKDALQANAGNSAITDEASALELMGWQPKIVEGRPDNIKITRPEDLALAKFFLEQQCLE